MNRRVRAAHPTMRALPLAITMTALLATAGCQSGTSTQVQPTSAARTVATTAVSRTVGTVAATVVPPSPSSVVSHSSATTAVRLSGRIVFRRYADADGTSGSLFLINADGSNEQPLTPAKSGVIDNDANWAPDGKRLVFSRGSGDTDGELEAHQLVTMSVINGKAGKETPLTAGIPLRNGVIAGWDQGPDFSPDGQRVAYVHTSGEGTDPVQHSDVFVIDADGTHPHRVTQFAESSGTTGGPRWSPDGKRLVFSRTLAASETPAGGQALFLINADGTGLHQLTPWTLMAAGLPDWSPVTNLIAFRAAPEESGIGNFFTIRPDGSGLTQVTHLKNTVISHQVGFSPDGRWLVFSIAPPDGPERAHRGFGRRI